MKHQIARSSFYDPTINRIDVLDNRYYFRNGTDDLYYPSVTTILEAYPKGWALEDWHKAVGYNADIILNDAARTGTKIHDAIKLYVGGVKLEFGNITNDVFVSNYTLEEWQMLCRFVKFWTVCKPRLIACEVTLLSDVYKLGGTIDLVVELMNENGEFERWIIDTKSTNYIHPTHELQIAAYAIMWNEVNPDYFIERAGILHLKATTRGADKSGKKIQGEKWQLKEFDRHYGDAFKVFKSVRAVWDNENPTWEPKNLSYPGSLQLPIDLQQIA